jgi:hypothetical protein
MILIYILILFFILLICNQLFLALFKNHLIEGMENSTSPTQDYKPYNLNDPNNVLILAQQNAGNIDFLKSRVEELSGVKKQVDTMQQSMDVMQSQIDGLVQQQADYASSLTGGATSPPDITGTSPETTQDIANNINNQ